jgi:hypothetical protein
MRSGGRRNTIAFFIVLGVCLVAGAVALNVGWIILNWREAGLLIAGLIVFPLIITGRRSQHHLFSCARSAVTNSTRPSSTPSRTSSRRRSRR